MNHTCTAITDHDKYGSCGGPRRRARAQFLHSALAILRNSRRTHPLQVERAVGLIDGIIQEDAFKAMLDDFAAKNHEVFDPTADENKLEYTVLHQQYQQMLEAHIEGKLVDAAVDLGGFLAALPTYVESAGAHERTGAVIELLRTLDSFVAFKDMMLTAKKALVGGAGVALGGENAQDAVAAVPELEASLALTATLEAGGAADGWVKTADKGWIQTFRKKDPEGGPIDMQRCVAHVKMPAEVSRAILRNSAQFCAILPHASVRPSRRPSSTSS